MSVFIAMAFAEVMIGLQNGVKAMPLQPYKPNLAANAKKKLEKFSATSSYYGGAAKFNFKYSDVFEKNYHKCAPMPEKRRLCPAIPETIFPRHE